MHVSVEPERRIVENERTRLLRLALQNERLLEHVRERQARFELLLDISHQLTRAHLDDDVLAQRIAQRGAEILGADGAGVLIAADDSRLVARGAFGDTADLFGDEASNETRRRLTEALRMSDAIMVPEVGSARVGMIVPLRAAWQVIGVFTAARGAARPFTADDVLVARIFATHAATALENARLYRETREASRRKDDFLARLAHELRNPLAPLVNGLQVLGRVAAAPDVTRLQAIMAHQVGHLGALVDEILDVSRVRFDKLTLKIETVDLGQVARHSFEALQLSPIAEGHNVALSVPPEPIVVTGDPIRLEQVVGNLLNNAVKYTPRGQPIRVTVTRTAADAVVTVSDRGIGIAPDTLPHLFNLFVQAEHSRDRAQGGLGLGLALVRALVERHGGAVTAYSSGLGHGSEFTVRLPLAQPTTRIAEDAGTRRRVLIVGSDAHADAMHTALDAAGHHVVTSDNRTAAVETAAFFRPDLVFIDLGLPGLDAGEIVQRMRRLPQRAHTRLIALADDAHGERLARGALFDGCLLKPVGPATILELIADVPSPVE